MKHGKIILTDQVGVSPSLPVGLSLSQECNHPLFHLTKERLINNAHMVSYPIFVDLTIQI